jgi:peptidoglycan/LPS O-acetylase OafA/YrhL
VDIFFVLSGFLITALLLVERSSTGRIKLAAFWGRRARRLLPALLVVLLVVVAVGRLVLPPLELTGLRWDALAALGYVANWRMIFRGGDYFAQTAPASPLQHTWSLGIEEQFYVLWPLLILLVLRLPRPRAAVLALCVLGTGAAAVASALLYHPGEPSRAYYGTDSRAGALLIGCALAALLTGSRRTEPARTRPSRWWAVAATPAAAAICWALATADGSADWLYLGGLTGLATAVAIVVAYLVKVPRGWGARLLALPPLAWLGRISYGVYLWHWPLFQFMTADRTGLTGGMLFGARMASALLAATLSFYLVELPIRRLLSGDPVRLRRIVWRALVPATVSVLAGTAAIVVGATVPPHNLASAAPAVAFTPTDTSALPSAGPSARGLAPIARAGRRPGGEPRIAFLGDSVSWSIGAYLPAHPGIEVTNRAVQGCGIARLPDIQYVGTPHTNYPGCDKWDDRWRAAVNDDDPDVSMILLNRWELMDRRIDGRYQHLGDPAYDTYITSELNLAISIAAGKGARVVLLTAAYTHRAERPDGGLWPEDTPQRVDAWNRLLTTVAAASPAHPVILDLNKVACPDGRFTWDINGLRARSDGLHFTPEGVQRIIAPWLLPRLAQLATTP